MEAVALYQKVKFGSSALAISAVSFFPLCVKLECVETPPIFSKPAIIIKDAQNRKTVYPCTTVAFNNDTAKKKSMF